MISLDILCANKSILSLQLAAFIMDLKMSCYIRLTLEVIKHCTVYKPNSSCVTTL